MHGLDYFLSHYRRADGLCRTLIAPDGTLVEEPAPASSFYHIVTAIVELAAAIGAS